MPGIDYSKWDTLDVSTSESESDGDDTSAHGVGSSSGPRAPSRPQTTKLAYPSRIVIGPNGATVQDMPAPATVSPFQPTAAPSTVTTGGSDVHMAPRSSAGTGVTAALADEDEAIDVLLARLTRNGGREGHSHLWSQTADSATVSFFVPSGTKPRHVLRFAITADAKKSEAECPTGVQPRMSAHIIIELAQDTAAGITAPFVISHDFRYPIKLEEELLEGCWQLQNLPNDERVLVVEVFKESLGIAGMCLWWDRCFADDTLSIVDTQSIADRKDTSSSSSRTNAASAFQKTWDEAHELFRERMKARRRAEK